MADEPSFDALIAAFALAPHEVQVLDPAHPAFDAARPVLVLPAQFEAARPLLRRRYPPHAEARVIDGGAVRAADVATLPLDAAAWLLPPLRAEEDRASIAGLRAVMERLFAPDGCPWDREQTPQTLRRYLLEETYELVDAIDRDDPLALREEIGDLFAHLFMQTALAQQAGRFTAEDVAEYAHAKFVRRHPHVFGDEEAGSTEALLDRWEAIKRAERASDGAAESTGAAATPPGALDSLPLAAPALQRARNVLSRAVRAGLGDAPGAAGPAVQAALAAGDVGALLLAAVRLADGRDIDAEEALREQTARFVAAFAALEGEARAAGVEVAALPLERRGAAWAAAERASAWDGPAGTPTGAR